MRAISSKSERFGFLAVPEENGPLSIFTLSIPSKLVFRNGLGKVISTITHDQFEISGKWSEALHTSSDVRGSLAWRSPRLLKKGPLQIDGRDDFRQISVIED